MYAVTQVESALKTLNSWIKDSNSDQTTTSAGKIVGCLDSDIAWQATLLGLEGGSGPDINGAITSIICQ